LGNPGVQLRLAWVVSKGLDDSDCQAVLRVIKDKDILSLAFRFLLFPMKEFFDSRGCLIMATR